MLIQFAGIMVLGPPIVAVLVFEVILNSMAMFNHGNVRLPLPLDRVLRWLIVTPDMHRIHHSVEDDEANSNFGFNLSWWDRLFGTYREQPRSGHEGMTFGIHGYRQPRDVSWLPGLLALPFRGMVTGCGLPNFPHGPLAMRNNLQRGLHAAAAFLSTRRGFADVHMVRGGISAWLEHGWPSTFRPEPRETYP